MLLVYNLETNGNEQTELFQSFLKLCLYGKLLLCWWILLYHTAFHQFSINKYLFSISSLLWKLKISSLRKDHTYEAPTLPLFLKGKKKLHKIFFVYVVAKCLNIPSKETLKKYIYKKKLKKSYSNSHPWMEANFWWFINSLELWIINQLSRFIK